MRKLALFILTLVNVVLFLTMVAAFVLRGAQFRQPWDGPAVVTVVLTVATLVLGAVALGVALLAVWGYTTLREHAANIALDAARSVARETARETADSTATRVVTAWLDRVEGLGPEGGQPNDKSVAGAYEGEGQ